MAFLPENVIIKQSINIFKPKEDFLQPYENKTGINNSEFFKNSTPWVEKYRPSNLDNYIGNEQLKQTISAYIEKQDIPHLLFYGSAGTGKTTLAKAITRNINCDKLYVNASDENSVENVRNKIKNFASSAGFSKLKVVIGNVCS